MPQRGSDTWRLVLDRMSSPRALGDRLPRGGGPAAMAARTSRMTRQK